MASDDGHVGIEIDGGLGLTRDTADAAADVDLGQHVTGRLQPAGQGNDCRQRRLEGGQPIGQPAGPGMEMERVDDQVMSPHGRQRVIEPIGRDAELGRT